MDRAHELIDRYFDDRLQGEEQAELAALLEQDQAVRAQFWSEAELRTQIQVAASRREAELQEETTSNETIRVSQRRFRASRHKVSISIAVAVAVVSAGLFTLHLMDIRQLLAGSQKKTNEEPRSSVEAEFVAKLSNWQNDIWQEGNRPPLDDPRLRVGRRLVITSGLAEITYFTGAKVILEGPAEYEVVGKNSGYLAVGRLNARVDEEEAKGFLVDIPAASVADFGTEFGVEVRPDESAAIHVFEGEVQLSSQSGGKRLLRADESIEVDSGKFRMISQPGDLARFVRRLPGSGGRAYDALPGRPIEVADASFEDTIVLDVLSGKPRSWQFTPANFSPVFDPKDAQFPGTTGDGVQGSLRHGGQVGLVESNATFGATTLSQQLAEEVTPGAKYVLSVWVGCRGDSLRNAIRPTGYQVELLAGDSTVIESINPVLPMPGKWRRLVISGVAPPSAGDPLVVRFTARGDGTQTFFDDVRLSVVETSRIEH